MFDAFMLIYQMQLIHDDLKVVFCILSKYVYGPTTMLYYQISVESLYILGKMNLDNSVSV